MLWSRHCFYSRPVPRVARWIGLSRARHGLRPLDRWGLAFGHQPVASSIAEHAVRRPLWQRRWHAVMRAILLVPYHWVVHRSRCRLLAFGSSTPSPLLRTPKNEISQMRLDLENSKLRLSDEGISQQSKCRDRTATTGPLIHYWFFYCACPAFRHCTAPSL